MARQGWGIEVIAWKQTCKKSLREWAETRGVFMALEDYYYSVTFLEGQRERSALDLTDRPFSKVSPKAALKRRRKEKAKKRSQKSAASARKKRKR